jgi:hypothetical protein
LNAQPNKDPFRREVYRDRRYVALTRKQFAVLEVLVAAEGGVISAEELLERAWDETPTRSPMRSASRSRPYASGSASPGSSPPSPASDTGSTQQPAASQREAKAARTPGLSVRIKLTLSYLGFLVLAVALLLAVAWVFLLRYIPAQELVVPGSTGSVPLTVFPVRSRLQDAFAPKAAGVLAFLLLFGF